MMLRFCEKYVGGDWDVMCWSSSFPWEMVAVAHGSRGRCVCLRRMLLNVIRVDVVKSSAARVSKSRVTCGEE